MFQYASGRALALGHGVELLTDLSFLQTDPKGKYTKRNYELNIFSLEGKFPNITEQRSIAKLNHNKTFRQLSAKFPSLFRFSFCQEKTSGYSPEFFSFPKNAYLDGFWQSEKHFTKYEAEIRKDFAFKSKPDAANQQWLDKIQRCTSVSLHVRRGDYISNAQVLAFHGICSEEYYMQAVEKITSTIKETDIELFIFSDDGDWVKSNMRFDLPMHVVDCNTGAKSYEDIRLMNHCKHNIIANSSFSWWGAWLNPNPSKIVIAPQHWFADPSLKYQDIVPHTWIKM
jgi:hypothetical protein